MTTFVLVHPAWLGGWCWRKVTPLLAARGHAVFTPTLTGLGERAHLATPEVGLATHVEDIVNVLAFEDLTGVVLVGNSSAGTVITGVADRAPERIAHVVYLDAFVPQHGQAMVDMIPPDRLAPIKALVAEEGEGWLVPRFAPPPWEEFVPRAWHITDKADLDWLLPRLKATPWRHFTEPVSAENEAAAALPKTYIRCLKWPNAAFDRFAERARSTPGWRLVEMDAPHLPFVTHAEEVAEALLEIVG